LNILVIDDHHLFSEGIKLVLSQLDTEVYVTTCNTCSDALKLIDHNSNFDIIILDLFMPDMNGFTALKILINKIPRCPIVVVSSSNNITDIRRAINLGAKGYVPKTSSPTVMKNALKLVYSGSVYIPPESLFCESELDGNQKYSSIICSDAIKDSYDRLGLTMRQTEVLKLLAEGKANKSIADILHCSVATVKAHVTIIFRALGVKNRTQALNMVNQMNIRF